jgi:hypothetical protein
MIDSAYFKNRLAKDVATTGDAAVVEVRLRNGQLHRIHKILSVEDGYVVLEAYDLRGNEAIWKEQWQEQVFEAKGSSAVSRAVVPYESIVDVLILRGQIGNQPRIGFGTVR